MAGPRTLRRRVIDNPNAGVVRVFRKSLAVGTTQEGWLAIEGPILFAEALSAGGQLVPADGGDSQKPAGRLTIHSVFVTEREAARLEHLMRQLPAETEVHFASDWVYERVTQTEAPRGIAALVELPDHKLDEAVGRPNALAVVACGLQDPGNIGTMVRSAQALGASALLALQNTVSPYNPKAVRSSAGAVLRLPIFTGFEPQSLIHRLHALKLRVLAADPRSAVAVHQSDLRGPVAVLIGKEVAGLDETLVSHADERVAIAIRRGTDSLNAATAASIVLYEAARQRGFHFDESL